MDKNIFLVGLNHRSAGVDVREKFALTNVADFELSLLESCPVREALALSTCNRVEILVVADAARSGNEDLGEAVLAHWAATCKGPLEVLRTHTYRHQGLDAVSHLFCVAASLDSMIMGEPQILGQLKNSYRKAVETGTARVVVNRLLHKSFSVAKRVRTETAIASSAVSISYAAVELAKKIFGELSGKTAMLIGAGEMAELAATHLLASGIDKLFICNRTYARAQELAKTMRGEAVFFEDMVQRLTGVDIVISSTGSPTAIIRAKDIREVLKKRRNRAMFFIDIAVPRDIDPDVNSLDNVYLYDIDDLKEVVEENISARKGEAVKARAIVNLETEAFAAWMKSLALQPTITDLLARAEDVGARELAKTLKRLGPVDDDTRQALEVLVASVGRKLLHEPICFLKRRTREEGSADRFIDMTRRIFNLDGDPVNPDAHLDRRGDETPLDCECCRDDESDRDSTGKQ
ncbi:glutamyl-tRNA reductase [Humidesulfovibrio mexicanus]|uniref:Glutamyl-tRNA reductase n=1 Tax=Humidesulfovibrio mexicanus TaxID=147047 RepID=A0A239D220_9BACT|nr:glutamyl-tRNA reductase [Humidesulfovibrio mexicanus]SNS25653.1 glutamyl-tRNA reductase [Humidesulfovibrio mexicanus]